MRSIGQVFDGLFGRGDAAVTVPPLDGAFRPNRSLDEARVRLPLADVDDLVVAAGRLHASAGRSVFALDADRVWQLRQTHASPIAALATVGPDALAVALADGDLHVEGGGHAERHRLPPALRCITAMVCDGAALYLANGSHDVAPGDWALDLMRHGASGSVWRLPLAGGEPTLLAARLAYPAGLALDGDGALVCAEAWRHRLLRLRAPQQRPEVLCADLPGYPGRLAAGSGGSWLAMFAPRSQLVEFVLREPVYRARMLAEVPPPYWIAPRLRSGRSFYEPLQGGAVKQLGQLKPWAPTLSAGLCVALDPVFQPRSTLQSRADGATHGVTAAVEHDGKVWVAARGDGVVVGVPVPAQESAP